MILPLYKGAFWEILFCETSIIIFIFSAYSTIMKIRILYNCETIILSTHGIQQPIPRLKVHNFFSKNLYIFFYLVKAVFIQCWVTN